jgi:hypothetical protein
MPGLRVCGCLRVFRGTPRGQSVSATLHIVITRLPADTRTPRKKNYSHIFMGDISMITTKPSAPRVRRHRQHLRDTGNVRFEVTIGADVAASIRALATLQQVPVWKAVEDALTAHVTGNNI